MGSFIKETFTNVHLLYRGPRKFSIRLAVGGTHFLKCLGRKFFGEKLKILGFAWGELTLDDTMIAEKCDASTQGY